MSKGIFHPGDEVVLGHYADEMYRILEVRTVQRPVRQYKVFDLFSEAEKWVDADRIDTQGRHS
jgi:hypothetical protein